MGQRYFTKPGNALSWHGQKWHEYVSWEIHGMVRFATFSILCTPSLTEKHGSDRFRFDRCKNGLGIFLGQQLFRLAGDISVASQSRLPYVT